MIDILNIQILNYRFNFNIKIYSKNEYDIKLWIIIYNLEILYCILDKIINVSNNKFVICFIVAKRKYHNEILLYKLQYKIKLKK